MQPEGTATIQPERSPQHVWQWLLRLRDGPPAPPPPDGAAEQPWIDLYADFARRRAATGVVVAHLGQSIDGFVATDSGDSYYVNGPENLDHLHRMRALADAVVVGAGTIAADDPALTTRRVSGANPVRVVLDGRRLPATQRVFSDGAAPTLLACAATAVARQRHGEAEVLQLPGRDGRVDPAALLAALAQRGLMHVFVEGGGSVVSAFLAAGVLDRLQIAIAPVMIGSGRRGIRAPAHARMLDCLRPQHRLYRMGADLLFDYDLRAPPSGRGDPGPVLLRLS